VLVDPDSRKVVMEVEILQAVCNNRPAELSSPENGWRSSVWLILDYFRKKYSGISRRTKGWGKSLGPRGEMDPSFVQILAVVAIIQVESLKAEEEKGSMGTAMGHG
jgi:hypothetical protein